MGIYEIHLVTSNSNFCSALVSAVVNVKSCYTGTGDNDTDLNILPRFTVRNYMSFCYCNINAVKLILIAIAREQCGHEFYLRPTDLFHDDVIKRKHFLRHWPSVCGIHQSPVNSPHKSQSHGDLMFSLICARIWDWVNNCEAGDLRRHRAYYYVIVMSYSNIFHKWAVSVHAWWHQASTRTNVDKALVKLSDIHLTIITHEIPQSSSTKFSCFFFKSSRTGSTNASASTSKLVI